MKRTIIFAAKLAVSVSLLLFLISIVDFNATLARLRNIKIIYAVIAFFISVGMVMLSALKWRLILRSDGLETRYLTLLRSCYVGKFLGLFLPSSFGGDIYRVYALTSSGKRLGKVTSSVLFDRLTGLFALVSIGLFGFISLPGTEYDLIVFLLYVTGIPAFFSLTLTQTINRLRRSDSSIVGYLTTILASFRAYRIDFRRFSKILTIALSFQFLIVINNTLYAHALSIDISFGQLLVIVPLVMLTEVLPISINGAGVRDTAFVFLFALIGHTKEEGLAIGLLVIAMRYIGGLVGGSILLISIIRRHRYFGRRED